MKQVGNAENSKLNGEWAKHVRRGSKKSTSGKRRVNDKKIIKCEKSYIEYDIEFRTI